MDRIRREYEQELDTLIEQLLETGHQIRAIHLLESVKINYSRYEHYKGICIQQYRRE